MKRILSALSLILTMLLIVSSLPVVLHADADAPFAGSGTVEDPYVIATAADFAALTDLMNASTDSNSPYGSGLFYKQTADIDMTGYSGYEGTHAGDTSFGKAYFGGFYDGAGHTLTVNIDAEGQTSIFPYIYGVIINLTFAGTINSDSTAQPIRTIQTGAVLANVVVDNMTITATNAGNGLCYSQYGTLLNVYVSGVARSKAVYNTNSGGSYYHVFTNVTKSTDGSALTHSTCTASNDIDAIAEAFNDRESDDFAAGLAALTMVCPDLTEEALGAVTVEDGKLVLSDGVLGGGEAKTLEGKGTKEEPYLISTPDDFKLFTDFMNMSTSSTTPYGAGEFFLQTADIDMTGYEGYDGTHVLNDTRKVYFGGIYNGAGHTITVDIEFEGQTGVFPYITGALLNLKIVGSIDSTTNSSTTSAQPIRAIQAGAVVANCLFDMTLTASKANGVTYSGYGTVFNVYVTGTAKKAVYNTNSGGSYYHVYTNVVDASGNPLTHSTTTATSDLDVIAAGFNNREDEAYTSGAAALAAVSEELTGDVLMPVYSDGAQIVFGEDPSAFSLGVCDGIYTSDADGVNKVTVIGSLTCTSLENVDCDYVKMTLEFRDDENEVVNTKTVNIRKIYATIRGLATTSQDTAAAAPDMAFIDATYLYAVTVNGVPAGSYSVFVTVEAILDGETVTSATTSAAIPFEF